ncbi:hypothetical protein Dda_2824 [Drechslerella dactyloides]|uniref:Uncharacterized protein n=1 Tax=Drechslerella dactyloides TaxID=74499 RepID=A0AAD6J165_DREDA|nr:hypothetical protein Dda_2824 [Drechslerella dactyloides]
MAESSETTETKWISPLAAHGWPPGPATPPPADPGTGDTADSGTGDKAEDKAKKPAWPHLKNLRKEMSKYNPYFSNSNFYGQLTESFGEDHDRKVDIVMVRIKEASAEQQQPCQIEDRQRWSKESDCQDFITTLRSHRPEQSTITYLLVQDITLAMLNFLYAELRIPPAFVASHLFGTLNAQKEGIFDFMTFNDSLRWSFHQSESGAQDIQPEISQHNFSTFCSKRDLQQDDSAGFHFDWKQLAMQSEYNASHEILALKAACDLNLAHSWVAMSNKNHFEIIGKSNILESSVFAGDVTEITLSNRIHRPHQTLFTTRGLSVESADERASWTSTECYGHKIALEAAVDDIDRTMSNTGELQQKINHWASSLSGYRASLSEVSHSIQNTQDYIDSLQASIRKSGVTTYQNAAHEEVAAAMSVLKKVLRFRTQVAERSNHTFQALMSSMSILESQKAITEASSVGKLTELAFIFIPVSFAATRLRTRIKESLKNKIYSDGIVPQHEGIPASAYIKICLPKLVGKDPVWSYTVILSFLALGIPLILTAAKTIAFKVVACILTFVSGVMFGRAAALWRIKSYTHVKVPMFPMAAVFLTGLFAFFWAVLEAELEAAPRIAIACGCAVVLLMLTGIFLRPRFANIAGVFLIAPLPLMLVIPAVLLFKPWSGQPMQLLRWRRGAIVVASCLGFTLAVGLCLLLRFYQLRRKSFFYDIESWLKKPPLPRYVIIVYAATAVGCLLPGLQLARIWGDTQLPRWGQLILTAVVVGLSVSLWLLHAFVLPTLAGTTFLLTVWVGEAEAFDRLSVKAKIAISLPWFFAFGGGGGVRPPVKRLPAPLEFLANIFT